MEYKGEPLVKGKRVTGFTNEEEEEVQLTHVLPIRRQLEGLHDHRQSFITGQNPASWTAAAQSLLKLLKQALYA